jgi:hypothetical protein
MSFLRKLSLSALLAIAFLAAPGLIGTSKADNGRFYDVCNSFDDALSVAKELDDIDRGRGDEDELVTNELYHANACSAKTLDLVGTNPPVVSALEPFMGSRYVVVQLDFGYAVVEESVGEPMDGQPEAFFQDASLAVRLPDIFKDGDGDIDVAIVDEPVILLDHDDKIDLPTEVVEMIRLGKVDFTNASRPSGKVDLDNGTIILMKGTASP